MSKLSKTGIDHVAKLARIELTEKEKEKFSRELSGILGYVEKLNKLHECTNSTNVTNHSGKDSKNNKMSVNNVEETSQVTGLENVYRKDIAGEQTQVDKDKKKNREKMLKNAPSQKDGYIKVRAILE